MHVVDTQLACHPGQDPEVHCTFFSNAITLHTHEPPKNQYLSHRLAHTAAWVDMIVFGGSFKNRSIVLESGRENMLPAPDP